MKIIAHLHTIYQLQTPQGPVSRVELELSPGSRLSDALAALNLHPDPDNTLLVVNRLLADEGILLADGDEVHIIPALSGGE